MLKLAGLILDQYDDPEFTSNAQVGALGLPTAAELAKYRDADFALIVKTASGKHRRYPTGTPLLAKISAAYFAQYGDQLPLAERKMAAERLTAATGKSIEASAAGSPHAVQVDKTAAAKLAEDQFIRLFDRMTPLERVAAATDLSKCGAATDRRVLDYVPSEEIGPFFKTGMADRRRLLADRAVALAGLDKLAAAARTVGGIQTAFALDTFDRTMKIASRVMDAYKTCWAGVRRKPHKPVTIEHYQLETLAKVYADRVHSVFAEPIATAFIRDPHGFYSKASGQVLATLRSLMKAVGAPRVSGEIKSEMGGPSQTPTAAAIHHIRSDAGNALPWSSHA